MTGICIDVLSCIVGCSLVLTGDIEGIHMDAWVISWDMTVIEVINNKVAMIINLNKLHGLLN